MGKKSEKPTIEKCFNSRYTNPYKEKDVTKIFAKDASEDELQQLEEWRKMEQSKLKNGLWKLLEFREIGAILPLVIGFVIFAANSDKFLTFDNMINVLRVAAFTVVCAIGESYLIISGGLDLSIGAVYSMGGVIAGLAMTTYGMPIWLSVVLALVSGALAGVLNGILIEKLEMPPFIATTGTQFVVKGLVQGITRGNPVYPLPESFQYIGQENLNLFGFGIPWLVIIALVLAFIFGWILKYTTYGRKLYAVGGNGEAARLAGIPTIKMHMGAYMLSGVLAALTGVLQASRLGSAQTTIGIGFEGTVIAGAVIGGISMAGGAGTIFGMTLGAFFMAMITNGMTLIKISAYWQTMVTGILLIFACSLEYIRKYFKAKLAN